MSLVFGRPDQGQVEEVSSEELLGKLVNLFRAPQHLPAHVDEILALSPRPHAAWFQLGIRHDAAAARLEAAGVRVVQDRCLMVEHARLRGRA